MKRNSIKIWKITTFSMALVTLFAKIGLRQIFPQPTELTNESICIFRVAISKFDKIVLLTRISLAHLAGERRGLVKEPFDVLSTISNLIQNQNPWRGTL